MFHPQAGGFLFVPLSYLLQIYNWIRKNCYMLYLIMYDTNSEQLVIHTSQIVDIFSVLSIKTYIRPGQVCTESLTTFYKAQYREEYSVNIPNDLLFSGLHSNYSGANKGYNRGGWFYFLWYD